MMNDNFLESLWDALLSRDPDLISQAFNGLDPASQAVVLDHLTKMVTEAGWHPEQRLSAQAALAALRT